MICRRLNRFTTKFFNIVISIYYSNMPKAVKTRFIAPYTTDSKGNPKTNLDFLQKKPNISGVYLIKSNRSEKIVYIGYSATQLYKTLYRHFQTWNDSQQPRKVYSKFGYTVRVIATTARRAALLEAYLIKSIQPRDNKDKLELLSKTQETEAAEILQQTPYISKEEDFPF